MIARSEEEVELFDQMDEELDWAEDMTRYDQVPDWLRASTKEEEEGEIGEFEDDESTEAPRVNKDQSEEDAPFSADGYEYQRALDSVRNNNIIEEAGSSGSSSHNRKLMRMVSPSVSSQKFGSLSALDSRSNSRSKKLADELEEGEIAVSGDSPMDQQQSGSWIQEREEGEDEQVLQPKVKRKRSIRLRPRHTTERSEEKAQ
ncbi:UNVERIFIED_CONTAM: ATP-dependent helicase BRM [Sesamum radiatum]|uniref:ATP-dependent helicase BRM n=1 Tax=Sesamum radiatum TaxID=300843 RepID=A0AAW2VM76_SESRA